MSAVSPTKRIKRCEAVYKELLRRKSPERIRTSDREEKKPPEKTEKKKELNDYQKFIQKESKRSKYSHLTGKEKLLAIAKAWKKKKDARKA